MVEKISEILRVCHEKWPTEIERHCFTYDIENNKLLLNIFYKGTWLSFNPEDDELDDLEFAIGEMSKWLT